MKNNKWFLLLCIFALPLACADENNETDFDELPFEVTSVLDLDNTAANYSDINMPNFFDDNDIVDEDNTPANNATTDWGATLGRVLFYDEVLSANNTISCSSCHLQANAFSDPDQFSTGFEGGLTGRNSMGLSNAKYYENGRFFWDERASTLEEQTLMPIQDLVEMGLTLDEMIAKLNMQDYYPPLFERAFGDATITSDRVSLALSQFVRSMVSYQSKYDEGRSQVNNTGQDFPNFTAQENLGKEVFLSANLGRCAGCHQTDLFVGDRAFNNGLDAITTDQGLGAVTGNPNDDGKFKVPSLRNIEVTGPYMHDGRFSTLEEVVEHYDSGVQAHPNLDNRLELPNSNTPRRLNLSDQEKAALVAFMRTLTDNAFMSDPKFSNPFREN